MRRAPHPRIPDREIRWRFSRSSGPGGQHVNTSDTRVELIWSLDDTVALSDEQKERVRRRLAGRLTDGELVIAASRFRSQNRNREDARARLEQLVSSALVEPKKRRPTKPSRAARARRVDDKRRRGETKQLRRPPSP